MRNKHTVNSQTRCSQVKLLAEKMSLTFTIKGNHKRYTQEYKEQKLNGKIVRLTSYENKTSDVHEHILRNIPSFADFIDRELHDRISSAEESQMKISDFTSN